MTFLDIAALADIPYEISRFVLRFASVMFLTYVLTLVISLVLTWRPSRKRATEGVEEVESVRAAVDTEGATPASGTTRRKEEIESLLFKVGDSDSVAEVAEQKPVPSWKREIEFSTAEVRK